MNLTLFSFILLGNLWTWRIFSFNLLAGIVCIFVSLLLYQYLLNKRGAKLFVAFFGILLLFQLITTDRISLTNLSNDQKRIQHMRLKEYPPVKFTVFGKTVWIPIAHWFEGRKETIAAFRMIGNISEVLDPNLYFFAGHPRERVGVSEFEKFPFILFPFFAYGLFKLVEKKKANVLFLYLILPIALISLIGNKNVMGPFVFFPFLVCASTFGMSEFFEGLENKKLFAWSFGFTYIFVLIQQYSYGIY